ncbi:hypothetical protein DID73_01115 [Candidatus Marinamargulisbacteria bacterium SCGC AG-343-K17]|nr:hypothetical protein DID73_01115 [Candidatus Marinamargulisbacteria bacterium SCGC AG-343-K17]
MKKRQPNLLIIDDDPNVFEMLSPTLDFCHVQPVFSKKSLPHALKNNIDGIILDYKMKQDNGLTFIPTIKNAYPNAFIILITAYGSKKLVIEGLQNNIDDYIEKPLNLKQIKESVLGHLKTYFGDAIEELNYHSEISAIQNDLNSININSSNQNLVSYSREKKLNYKYTSRLFKEKTGKNFRSFKLEKKVKLAKELLENTPLKIAEISNRLNYMNPSAFMKMFKSETGLTPSNYRKKFKK